MLAGACAAHPTPQVVPELPPIKPGEWEGTRWEYVCLHIGPGWTDLWDDEMLELFNVWGAGGWELFYVGHEAACFKRPRESASSLVMLADHPDPPPLDGP
jgi:hypothetical protein